MLLAFEGILFLWLVRLRPSNSLLIQKLNLVLSGNQFGVMLSKIIGDCFINQNASYIFTIWNISELSLLSLISSPFFSHASFHHCESFVPFVSFCVFSLFLFTSSWL